MNPPGSSINDVNVTLKTFFIWVGAITVAVGGATFAITRLSVNAQIAALETELRGAKEQLTALESARTITSDEALLESDDPEVRDLARRIAALEHERNALLLELAETAPDVLDPASELGSLASQLSSRDRQARNAAVEGLFALEDERAFAALVSYFKQFPDEATSTGRPARAWLRLLWRLDGVRATIFAIQLLEADNTDHAEVAYKELMGRVGKNEQLQAGIAPLQTLALRSADPLVRTRAKLLLNTFQERLGDGSQSGSG